MHDYLAHTSRPARLLIAGAAFAAATTIAACGSSSPTAASSSTGSGSNATSSTVSFSNCMRANGVPNFPDLRLGSNGMRIEGTGQTISVNGVSLNAPAFLAARQECVRYRPHTQAMQAERAQQTQRGLNFARCMRSHGVPNFPDPKGVSSHGGNQVAYLPGVNLQAPAVQGAAKACGGGPKGP